MKVPFELEQVDLWTVRYKVFGGWIVNSFSGSVPNDFNSTFKTSVFVPDANHEWEL